MSNLTLGGLTLCKNKDSEYKWIRADVTPQGWNPVGTTDSDVNQTPKMNRTKKKR